MSMNPGATTLPAASMVRLRGAAVRLLMAAFLPSRMPTSPEYQGEPVPSMMWPWVMTRSKPGVWAERMADAERKMRIDRANIDFNEAILSTVVALTTSCLFVIEVASLRG